jgi:pimeloyl-ACP methyl ester carboxylesterase
MAITAPRSGLAPVNGLEVWYEVHGEGRPRVLLHGGFGSSEQFGPTLPALAADMNVHPLLPIAVASFLDES